MRKANGTAKTKNRPGTQGNEGRANGIVSNPKARRGARDRRPIERNAQGANEMDDLAAERYVQRYPDTIAARLDVIYRTMAKEFFGIRKAAKMVGGRMRLEQLIIEGRVRADKPTAAQNGKWQINAADVLANIKI